MATDLSEAASVSIVQGGIVSPGAEDVSPLEQDLLDEYERLADNMKKVSSRVSQTKHSCRFRLRVLRVAADIIIQLAGLLDALAGASTSAILDGLRQLERKTSLVFTLLKAGVYSIVLQQEIYSGDQPGGQES